MDVEPTTLSSPNLEEADDLIATLEPDTTANEQTWPTDAELQTGAVNGNKNGGIPDAREGTTPRSVRKVKVPKGMSAYQAAWIVEEEDDDDDGWEDDNEGDAKMEDDKPTTVGDEEEEMEMIDEEDESSMKGVRFEDLEEEEEGKQCDLCSIVTFFTLF
jgi:pre-rRNA-processing protein TSR1